MTLSPAFLDELRARVTLSSVISPHVKLTRAGREWKACCPFHNEKTPSFTVNDEKHFYHCFGCGAHGDAIRFLTDSRGLPFMDAVKELAASAGMEVPAPDPRSRARAERQATLHDVMAAAQAWFAEQLDGIEGAEARAYCQRRGIGAAAIKRFGIGFAPDRRQGLRKALAEHTDAKLIEAGLLISVEEKEPYDRFRGRLMFPIRESRGRVIGFGGRILGPGEPKYLNSPETPLFDKGSSLYNLDRASPASRAAKRLIVVEGYMDVIGLDRGGIGEAVAPNGTALTERQLELLWRLDPSPILCFDGDAAGSKAAIRAATRALPLLGPERTLSFVALPEGQDPDDLVNSGGREAVEALLQTPEPLVDRLWRHERDSGPLTTPEERAGLKQRLLDHAAAIADRSLSQLYRDEWMERFFALNRRERPAFTPSASQQRRGTYVRGRGFIPPEPPASAEARAIGETGVDRHTARALVAGLTRFPDLVVEEAGILAALPFADPAAEKLKHRLLDQALRSGHLDSAVLAPILAEAGTAQLLEGTLGGFGKGFSFNRTDTEPAQARADLRAVIELLGDRHEIAQGLAEVSGRVMDDPEAVAEQHRLLLANQETTKRLADYSASD
jgi:DNA primase